MTYRTARHRAAGLLWSTLREDEGEIAMLRWITAALLLLSFAAPVQAAPDVAAKVKAAVERDQGLPRDAALYADQVTIGHSWDEARTLERAPFVAALSKELGTFDRVLTGRKWELVRFVVAGDTIVATTRQTGMLPDGSEARSDTAYFFTLEHGRIARIETWYDRLQSQPILQALSDATAKETSRGGSRPSGR
jgi:ketosteroid isomerase-like protein